MYNASLTDQKMLQIGVRKSVLKERKTNNADRVVYMDNGEEFQLNIFNPTTETISAEIYINGKIIPNSLVLRPGERVWLERYLDKSRKFKFETYEVEAGNAAVDAAIARNGEIMVKFYKERQKPIIINEIVAQPLVYYSSDITTGSPIYKTDYTLCDVISDSVNTTATARTLDCDCDCTLGLTGAASVNYCSSSITGVTGALNSAISASSASGISRSLNDSTGKARSKSTKETGRVNEGGYSNQSFTTVDKDFECWAFKTETIKIMPMSEKPYTASETKKIYCSGCGRKLKAKYKFCPFCGTEID